MNEIKFFKKLKQFIHINQGGIPFRQQKQQESLFLMNVFWNKVEKKHVAISVEWTHSNAKYRLMYIN